MTSIVDYKGKLRTVSTHVKSGEQIITDAPVDNNGKGEAFSPTDMVANSVATCMLTVMGIAAEKKDISIEGAKAEVEKIMASNPRRIAAINVKVTMPQIPYENAHKKLLEKVAGTCPVLQSIHPEIKKKLEFVW